MPPVFSMLIRMSGTAKPATVDSAPANTGISHPTVPGESSGVTEIAEVIKETIHMIAVSILKFKRRDFDAQPARSPLDPPREE